MMMKRSWKPSVGYLYPAVLLYSIAFFATSPDRATLLLSLVRYQLCGQMDEFDDDDGVNCNEDEVSKQGATLLTWAGLLGSISQILVAGPMGALANNAGRTYPAAIVCFGAAISYLMVTVIAHFKLQPEWMVLSSITEGISGTYPILLMCTSSYVADLNTLHSLSLSETDKVERYSFVEASLSIGVLLGPLSGGIIVSVFGYALFFFSCAMVQVVVMFYFLLIPDSLSTRPRSLSFEDAFNRENGAFQVIKLAFQTRPIIETSSPPMLQREGSNRGSNLSAGLLTESEGVTGKESQVPAVRLSFISIGFMLVFGNNSSGIVLLILYSTREWNWGPLVIGAYVSCIGGAGIFSLLFFRRIYKWVCAADLSDFVFIRAGAIASIAFYLLFAALSSPTAAFALLPLTAFALGAPPSYRSIYANCFSPEDKSRVFAAVSMMEGFANIITPLIYNPLFGLTVSTSYPQAVFLVVAFAAVIAFLFLNKAQIKLIVDDEDLDQIDETFLKEPEISGVDSIDSGEGASNGLTDVQQDQAVNWQPPPFRPRLLSDSAVPSNVSTNPLRHHPRT